MNDSKGVWLGIGSLIVAVVAVVIAIQSNEIARNASQANISVKYQGGKSLIHTSICFQPSNDVYHVERRIIAVFDVANNGGQSTSLVKVGLSEDPDTYWQTTLNIPSSQEEGGMNLPMDIPSGSAKVLRIESEYFELFKDKNRALRAAKIPPEKFEYALVTWALEFSDDTISEISDTYQYFQGQKSEAEVGNCAR